ncbi:hypothetical protein, partial [Flavobacterium sp. ALD4]|uniref:hypothetical protein n=1 Tax=Flavobacterium sp. ALD4 TaxID=2058314 RepID=UPI0012FEB992
MKQKYYYLILLITISLSSFGQTTGDFRSKTGGPAEWNTYTSWQIFNGTWNDAILSDGYPGENSTTSPYPTVTILAGQTINISLSLTIHNEIKELIIFGTLAMGDRSSTQNNTSLITNLITIESTGTLNFNGGKVRLTLPNSNAAISVSSGGKINGNCTANDEIFIGSTKYATCTGGGSNTYSFGKIETAGGTLKAEITDPSIENQTIEACTSVSGGYIGPDNVVFKWNLTDVDGNAVAINTFSPASGNLATSDDQTTASFSPIAGQYLLSLEITKGTITNIATRNITVTDDATPPTINCP